MSSDQRGRSPRPGSTIRLVVGLGILVIAAILGAAAIYMVDRSDTTIEVLVKSGDLEAAVEVSPSATVADALVAAGIAPHNGRLLSAKDQRVLDPMADPATYVMDDLPATSRYPLYEGASIEVIDGEDLVEETEVKEVPIPAPPLREVIKTVHQAGSDGLERLTVGVRSGEEIEREVITEAVAATPVTDRVVALTFDDGPSETWTGPLLDLLAERGVKATFCMVGRNVSAHPSIVKRIVEEGHQLCNHTLDHEDTLLDQPASVVEDEIGGGLRAVTTEGFDAPRYFRAPGGAMDDQSREIAWNYDQVILHWTVDTRDWEAGASPDSILLHLQAELEPGAIILMHDGGGESRAVSLFAAAAVIDHLKAEGYTFTFPVVDP